jgi:hypothetical protein
MGSLWRSDWPLHVCYLAGFALLLASEDWAFGWIEQSAVVRAVIVSLFVIFLVGTTARLLGRRRERGGASQ